MLVWSAVACSSAFPFLYAPQQLLARDSRGEVRCSRRAMPMLGRGAHACLPCPTAPALPTFTLSPCCPCCLPQVVGLTANAAGEMQRRWRDGSLEEDLPMRGLR